MFFFFFFCREFGITMIFGKILILLFLLITVYTYYVPYLVIYSL